MALVAENLCLRQQLVVLRRRQARPRFRGADPRVGSEPSDVACRLSKSTDGVADGRLIVCCVGTRNNRGYEHEGEQTLCTGS